MEKLTYSVTEAARLLGIGRNLAYQLVQEGKIPSIRIGEKRIVIPVDAISHMLNACGTKKVPRLTIKED